MALPVRRSNGDRTDVVPKDSFEGIDGFNRQLASLLDSWRRLPEVIGNGFTPLADIEETDDAYHVEIDLSGVKKDDIDVEISQRHLRVTGERKEKERAGILRRRERVVGRFSYEVTLPGDVEEDAVEATLEDGVLTVRVPKGAADRLRRIEVLTETG